MNTLAFACYWGPDRRATWSGTPAALSAALSQHTRVMDVDVTLSAITQRSLKLAAARRIDRHWESKWRHGPVAEALVERRLRSRVSSLDPDIVLEIGDLGIVDRPYAVLQDLSYDLLLDHFGERGVPHFRSLSKSRLLALRDRQLRIYDDARMVLAMSHWLAQRCVEAGADPARVRVVNPGMNAPMDLDRAIPQRRRGDTRRLLFIGRDFDTKAGDQVVAAFGLLRRALGPYIRLTVAGPKSWPLATPPGDGIDYLGPVPAIVVQDLYDTHDLFVMPSRFEGFGIAFVEALVRGMPCIGRNVCAMPEIITPGDAGLLVTSEDPSELAAMITTALEDDSLYLACAQAVPRRRQHFTWSRAASEIVTALDPATIP